LLCYPVQLSCACAVVVLWCRQSRRPRNRSAPMCLCPSAGPWKHVSVVLSCAVLRCAALCGSVLCCAVLCCPVLLVMSCVAPPKPPPEEPISPHVLMCFTLSLTRYLSFSCSPTGCDDADNKKLLSRTIKEVSHVSFFLLCPFCSLFLSPHFLTMLFVFLSFSLCCIIV
jgi:hypothetical protein